MNNQQPIINDLEAEVERLKAELADAYTLSDNCYSKEVGDSLRAQLAVMAGWLSNEGNDENSFTPAQYIAHAETVVQCKGAAPLAAYFSCPYCPVEGITTKGEYEKHLATHEKPAAPDPFLPANVSPPGGKTPDEIQQHKTYAAPPAKEKEQP